MAAAVRVDFAEKTLYVKLAPAPTAADAMNSRSSPEPVLLEVLLVEVEVRRAAVRRAGAAGLRTTR